MGEFADGRGLAGAVHPDHQHDMGMLGGIGHERLRQGLEHACNLRGEHRAHRLWRNAPLVAASCDGVADAPRHGDAEIGLDQHLFELIERRLVELPLGERAGEIVRQRGRAARQSPAKLGEPAPSRRGLRRRLTFAHGATTASSAEPSSPLTTASISAPAPRSAASLTGVKSAERPCASFSMSTLDLPALRVLQDGP